MIDRRGSTIYRRQVAPIDRRSSPTVDRGTDRWRRFDQRRSRTRSALLGGADRLRRDRCRRSIGADRSAPNSVDIVGADPISADRSVLLRDDQSAIYAILCADRSRSIMAERDRYRFFWGGDNLSGYSRIDRDRSLLIAINRY